MSDQEKRQRNAKPTAILLIIAGAMTFVGAIGKGLHGGGWEAALGAAQGQLTLIAGLYMLRQSRKAAR